MSKNSKIEWTDHTFNPWWGCIEVSPACDNCYARTFAKRTGHDVWGAAGETGRRFFADKHWAEPLKWNRDAAVAGERRRVFCASMADVFEQNEALDIHRERLWALITSTPNLDWLLLTKRPQNIRRMVPKAWLKWPPFNVWYGTTVEDQHYADQRIPILLAVPAAVRFLSMEPLLGPVDLTPWLVYDPEKAEWSLRKYGDSQPLSWIITGGESGPHARPSHPGWYRSLRDQCVEAGVAFHFKQHGEYVSKFDEEAFSTLKPASIGPNRIRWVSPDGDSRPVGDGLMTADDELMTRVGVKAAGRVLDGRTWDELPATRPTTAAGGTGGAR